MLTCDSGNFRFPVTAQGCLLQWPFPSQSSIGKPWSAAANYMCDAQRSYYTKNSSSSPYNFHSAEASFSSSASGDLPLQSTPSNLTSISSSFTFRPYAPHSNKVLAAVATKRRPYAPTQAPPPSAAARGPNTNALHPSTSSPPGMPQCSSSASAPACGNTAPHPPSTSQFPGRGVFSPCLRPEISTKCPTPTSSDSPSGAFGSPVQAGADARGSAMNTSLSSESHSGGTGGADGNVRVSIKRRPYAPLTPGGTPAGPAGALISHRPYAPIYPPRPQPQALHHPSIVPTRNHHLTSSQPPPPPTHSPAPSPAQCPAWIPARGPSAVPPANASLGTHAVFSLPSQPRNALAKQQRVRPGTAAAAALGPIRGPVPQGGGYFRPPSAARPRWAPAAASARIINSCRRLRLADPLDLPEGGLYQDAPLMMSLLLSLPLDLTGRRRLIGESQGLVRNIWLMAVALV